MKEQTGSETFIRFITSDYRDLFRIRDGGTIQVTFPDRTVIEKCRFIDEYHTKIGTNIFHICEYAELLEKKAACASRNLRYCQTRLPGRSGAGDAFCWNEKKTDLIIRS